MENMLSLVGILIVIIGFAFRLDSILTIMVAAVVTALVSPTVGLVGLLDTLGSSFVGNRAMTIFIVIMLVTGTLERNGLKEAAAALIGKFKNSTSGMVIGIYGVMRAIFGAFNVGFGGVAGFVKPIVMPMAVGAVESKGIEPNEEHVEELKGMASGMENIAWFFCQVLFVGGGGGILVQQTLATLGYQVELLDLAKIQIPIALVATLVAIVYYLLKDRKLRKKYYPNEFASTKEEK